MANFRRSWRKVLLAGCQLAGSALNPSSLWDLITFEEVGPLLVGQKMIL